MIKIYGKEVATQEAYWQIVGEQIRSIAALSQAALKEEREYHGSEDDTLLERILAAIADKQIPYGLQDVFVFREVFPDLFGRAIYPEDGNTSMERTFSQVYRDLLHDHFVDDPAFADVSVPFETE